MLQKGSPWGHSIPEVKGHSGMRSFLVDTLKWGSIAITWAFWTQKHIIIRKVVFFPLSFYRNFLNSRAYNLRVVCCCVQYLLIWSPGIPLEAWIMFCTLWTELMRTYSSPLKSFNNAMDRFCRTETKRFRADSPFVRELHSWLLLLWFASSCACNASDAGFLSGTSWLEEPSLHTELLFCLVCHQFLHSFPQPLCLEAAFSPIARANGPGYSTGSEVLIHLY